MEQLRKNPSVCLIPRDPPRGADRRAPFARTVLSLSDEPLECDTHEALMRRAQGRQPWQPTPVLLDGKVLPCCCPECGFPLTVRQWLGLADCYNCGTSIALEPWERQVHRFSPDGAALGHHQQARTESLADPLSLDDAPASIASQPEPPPIYSVMRERSSTGAGSTESRPPRRLRRRRRQRLLPAWLTSLLFHLALLILLALITYQRRDEPQITLALEVGPELRPGDRESLFTLEGERFDLPLPEGDRPRSDRERRALLQANQQARELRLEVPQTAVPLPELLEQARSDDVHRRAFALRDPRLRVQLVRKHGGTTLTEAAVARGLRWIAAQQRQDGSWPLQDNDAHQAGTSLALLPYLGAGQTHLSGLYTAQVAGGLRYLLNHQDADGDLRGDSSLQFGMYVHGQATIVLCEALAMTHDERLREPAQRAVDFIVAAQHPRGGWRYEPGQEGDTSVLGWQLMALQSARAAGLEVPTDTLDLADQYLETVQSENGAFYAYQPYREPTHVMTAEALLCRMYLGWGLDHPGIRHGTRTLVDEFLPAADDPDYYYWYYATQAIHHVGGRLWKRWNQALREELVSLQRTQGRHAGSWDPDGPHASVGGRLYVTSLAVCTLEIYYRHAPIFRQIDLRAGTR